ncbi:D-lactate dehydrogenase NDAI_0A03060 [Naumovozyma dairenensis CBS 421]|uniref:D-lactate dehydrogenase (cytochrome) n=1 Tax=Naumovozyma dairenensis (strain ATCC 10597 / BCRC 20456 / CBS 421 / NBRC 0211 / NRRL Y-12639) TaxID=1071378 RepID=G0W3S5_NAUDC|nr:hypothetical protein NDAI_0A03060 [Naumovozyma dairenensis CBS 421]CCD22463.1 hypothetical protein NDAI_0A03060 [Naumovozyma dairenensis CBS 421]
MQKLSPLFRRNHLFKLLASFGKRYLSLTSETYPEVKRSPNFKKLTKQDITFFQSLLSKQEIIQATPTDSLTTYNEDWMKKYKGNSQLVLKPKTVPQISEILKYCQKEKLAVVPQGGNTGLVGGSIPIFDEIILSLSNLNKIRSFDLVSGILKCDAGLVLESASDFVSEYDYLVPLDLGAKGSCQMGGVVATNAGGLRLLKYGSLHGSVLGLEVVLADGRILNSLDAARKDNTGYDWKQLFIGSEGTLGIITAVSILTVPKPKCNNVAFLAVNEFKDVLKVFKRAKMELNEILSAFEFMDNKSQVLTQEYLSKDIAFPLEGNEYPFYILIETSGSNKEHDDSKLETFLENVISDELVVDGTMAQDESELQNLWNWREMIPESTQLNGGVYKYDVSLPLEHLYSLVEATNTRLADAGLMNTKNMFDSTKPVLSAVGFGHIGDGNLHLNVSVRNYDKNIEKVLEPFVYEYVSSKKGSISAEHGLGFQKKIIFHIQKARKNKNLKGFQSLF